MLSKHIDFKGMNNLRDLGGMTNVLGKKIKSNLLFRSDHLHNATQADMEKLKKLGVRYILDLRNLEERTEQPDQKIEGIKYIPMPLNPERNAGIAKDKKSREELQKDAIEKTSTDPKFFFMKCLVTMLIMQLSHIPFTRCIIFFKHYFKLMVVFCGTAQVEKIVPESSQFFYVKFCKFLKRILKLTILPLIFTNRKKLMQKLSISRKYYHRIVHQI